MLGASVISLIPCPFEFFHRDGAVWQMCIRDRFNSTPVVRSDFVTSMVVGWFFLIDFSLMAVSYTHLGIQKKEEKRGQIG